MRRAKVRGIVFWIWRRGASLLPRYRIRGQVQDGIRHSPDTCPRSPIVWAGILPTLDLNIPTSAVKYTVRRFVKNLRQVGNLTPRSHEDVMQSWGRRFYRFEIYSLANLTPACFITSSDCEKISLPNRSFSWLRLASSRIAFSKS